MLLLSILFIGDSAVLVKLIGTLGTGTVGRQVGSLDTVGRRNQGEQAMLECK